MTDKIDMKEMKEHLHKVVEDEPDWKEEALALKQALEELEAKLPSVAHAKLIKIALLHFHKVKVNARGELVKENPRIKELLKFAKENWIQI